MYLGIRKVRTLKLQNTLQRSIQTVARKYSLNANILDDGITTKKQEWFWGMYMTDGHVRMCDGRCRAIGFGQKYDSFNILYFIREALESNHLIFIDKTKKGSYVAGLEIYNKHLADTVFELAACRQGKKSFDIEYPSPIICPTNDHSNLIRGIFDGDGSFGRAAGDRFELKFSSSSKRCLDVIQQKISTSVPGLRKNGSFNTHREPYCDLRYHTTSDIINIGDWFYEAVPEDWMLVANEYDHPLSKFMVPYHRKKYDRHQWLKKIYQETPKIRAEAMRHLIKEEERIEKEILLILHRMSVGMEDNPYGFHFRQNFVDDAEIHLRLDYNKEMRKH